MVSNSAGRSECQPVSAGRKQDRFFVSTAALGCVLLDVLVVGHDPPPPPSLMYCLPSSLFFLVLFLDVVRSSLRGRCIWPR